jgi:hypothetical protein
MSRNITVAELADILARAIADRLAALPPDLPVAPRNEPEGSGTAGKRTAGSWELTYGDRLRELVASWKTPWPPPAPGTHESDLHYTWHGADCWVDVDAVGHDQPGGSYEYAIARNWSRANAP